MPLNGTLNLKWPLGHELHLLILCRQWYCPYSLECNVQLDSLFNSINSWNTVMSIYVDNINDFSIWSWQVDVQYGRVLQTYLTATFTTNVKSATRYDGEQKQLPHFIIISGISHMISLNLFFWFQLVINLYTCHDTNFWDDPHSLQKCIAYWNDIMASGGKIHEVSIKEHYFCIYHEPI